MPSSHTTTNGITVTVDARYAPDHSAPARRHWFFLYTITIANSSDVTVQLVSRHWIITDDDGHIEEVKGPGVVGEQPVLMPGESFQYTSGCPLTTPTGEMRGTYQMITPAGEQFDADVGPFVLRGPYTVH